MKDIKRENMRKRPTVVEIILSLFMLFGFALVAYSYIKGARIDFLKLIKDAVYFIYFLWLSFMCG